MQIAFLQKELRDLCINKHLAITKLGPELANRLLLRVADLRAAPTASDIFFLPGTASPSSDGELDIISVDLLKKHYLACASGHPQTPTLNSGAPDWTKVRRIKIIGIKEASR